MMVYHHNHRVLSSSSMASSWLSVSHKHSHDYTHLYSKAPIHHTISCRQSWRHDHLSCLWIRIWGLYHINSHIISRIFTQHRLFTSPFLKVIEKYDRTMFRAYCEAFTHIPLGRNVYMYVCLYTFTSIHPPTSLSLASIINNTIFVVHGGLFHKVSVFVALIVIAHIIIIIAIVIIIIISIIIILITIILPIIITLS